jgi:hypothetical protein
MFRALLHRVATRANATDPITSPCELVHDLTSQGELAAPPRRPRRRG